MAQSLPKEKLQQMILIGIVTVSVLAAMWLFWIGPQVTALLTARARVGDLQAEVARLQGRSLLEQRNLPMLEQIVASCEPLRAGTVTGDPYMWVVLAVNQLIEGREIRMPTPQPAAKAVHPRLPEYEVYAAKLEWEGTYDHIGELVRDFENRFPLGEIRSVRMAAIESDGPGRQATLEAVFFVWPENKLKAGVGSK